MGHDDKYIVPGAVDWGGEIQTEVIADRREATMIQELKAMLVPGARVVTDEHKSYRSLASSRVACSSRSVMNTSSFFLRASRRFMTCRRYRG